MVRLPSRRLLSLYLNFNRIFLLSASCSPSLTALNHPHFHRMKYRVPSSSTIFCFVFNFSSNAWVPSLVRVKRDSISNSNKWHRCFMHYLMTTKAHQFCNIFIIVYECPTDQTKHARRIYKFDNIYNGLPYNNGFVCASISSYILQYKVSEANGKFISEHVNCVCSFVSCSFAIFDISILNTLQSRWLKQNNQEREKTIFSEKHNTKRIIVRLCTLTHAYSNWL